MAVGGYIVIYMLLLACAAVCALKDRRALLALGVLLPVAWVLGALAAAKPQSLWAWTFAEDAGPPSGR